ncbi:hypothetical protein D3C71_1481350 [compost metagenome]
MRGHGLFGLRQRGVDHADMGQQLKPRRRWPGTAADPLDQLQAKTPFQLAHLQADRRLGHAPALGGGGETAQLNDLREEAQMVQVQAAHGAHQKFCLCKS